VGYGTRAQASTRAGKTARQAKSKKENRYVIKVMNSNREGGQVFWFARTKGQRPKVVWSL
jgi:hypothetical protein